MASFLGKINRMRNMRLHVANEYVYPSSSLYHEIIQGIPWAGGFTRVRPKRVNLNADRLLAFVMKKRPQFRNYAWCPPDNGGVYVHPGVWTSDRMQHHLDSNPHMNIHEAFGIADKEMNEKQAELDLQVSLAREHAARLGVNNQGVQGMLERANKVYAAVYDMRYEEAKKRRRLDLADVCRELAVRSERLDMQDIIEVMPIKEEQMQFFRDYPEFRELFPPLWYIAEEVVQAQAQETSQRTGKAVRDGSEAESFVEEEPNSRSVDKWPPQYVFDREARNNEQKQQKDGVSVADAELLMAKQEALKYLTKEYQASQQKTSQYEPEEGESLSLENATLVVDDATANSLLDNAEALGEAIYTQEKNSEDFLEQAVNSRSSFADTLKRDNDEFYQAYRDFLYENRSQDEQDLTANNNSEYKKVLSERDQTQAKELQKIAAKYLDSANTLDADAIAAIRKDIREQLGPQVEDVAFDIAEGGGAVSAREFSGFTPFDELAPRTVNLVSNLELSPFYPENAFPPRGVTADPSLNLKDVSSLTQEQQQQLESLKAFGAKYAHAIEDHAPVKSQAYIEESIKWGVPIVSEHIPALETNLESQAKELLAVKKQIEQEGEPKTLAEYKQQVTDGTSKPEGEDAVTVRTEAALKHLKQQLLDELANKAFDSTEERKEYENMLEKRYEYLVAKKKEVYEQWAQYWPSDKPEALIYRGPEVIREIFPEAYRLAVNRQYEELTGVPLKEALTIKPYRGLWKTVRSMENNARNVKDLSEQEWQYQIELDPAYYRTSAPKKDDKQ